MPHRPQAEALATVYAGVRGRDGRVLAPGFPPGAETGPGGWGLWITGEAPGRSLQTIFATQTAANMVFDRADWDVKTFDFEKDQSAVEARLARVLNATDPDLEAFRKRGGKLILFHGWNDAALPPQGTIDYVDAVRARMGRDVADSFVRLYMMPGLQHCFGGPGAHYCGGLAASTRRPRARLLGRRRAVGRGRRRAGHDGGGQAGGGAPSPRSRAPAPARR